MTPQQKKDLEPFAEAYWKMEQMIRQLPPDELGDLRDACNAVNGTNCWYATFEAAHIVGPMVNRRILEMKRAAEAVANEQHPRVICERCGTVTTTRECDCTKFGHEPRFVPFRDEQSQEK